jgi:predicted HicB family RNase H-like nuclease
MADSPLMAKKEPRENKPMIKTTLRLSQDLWRQARVRALDERVSFQDIVERALTKYLKEASTTRGGSR